MATARFPLAIAVVTAWGLLASCTSSDGYPVLPGQPTTGWRSGVSEDAAPATATETTTLTATATSTGTTDETNALDVVVDHGPEGMDYLNGIFASVTLCVPGTSTCQTLDHLLVDTGSVGVRVLESKLTLALPAVAATSGGAVAECTPFMDGTAWGPIKQAEVRLGQKTANSLSIQAIGVSTFRMPSSCTGTPITDFESLGANGILGVGVYLQDCGSACQVSGRKNPGLYYACSSTACSTTAVALAQQVSHPVAAFSSDNNGVIIQLPSIASSGAVSVSGRMLFGIGTRSNNALGSSSVLPLDANGYVTTTYPVGGSAYSSFLDSGSNAVFFLDATTSKIATCAGMLEDFYCPGSTLHLTALLSGTSGTGATVSFSVANAASFSASDYAFDDLAGPMPSLSSDASMPGFDWGLPFFFGRNVATSIEQQETPAGTGPYFAF